MTQGRILFTIGHSSHDMERFIELLHAHGITAIADVRSQPYSRIYPHFARESLREALRGAGIHYVFLGRELGARRDEPECYVHGQATYDRVARTPAFQKGLARVVEGSANQRIALLCAEKDPLTCHRSVLVCRHLANLGLDVRHILADGSLETHAEAEHRLMVEEGLNPDQMGLFDTADAMNARIAQAYELRGDRIAYRIEEAQSE